MRLGMVVPPPRGGFFFSFFHNRCRSCRWTVPLPHNVNVPPPPKKMLRKMCRIPPPPPLGDFFRAGAAFALPPPPPPPPPAGKRILDAPLWFITHTIFFNPYIISCWKAYKQGLTGDGYVWFFFSWYSDGWYLVEDSSVSCTRAEMKEAVEGSFYISTQAQNIIIGQEPTLSGLVTEYPSTQICTCIWILMLQTWTS